MTIPVIGQPAPDFGLQNQYGEVVSLQGLRGSRVLLNFYPFAFSATCGSEWLELRNRSAELSGVRVLGISVDSKYALRAYAESAGLPFELLSDFWPHGKVCQAYGIFDAERGMAERGSFVLDESGTLRASFFAQTGEARPWSAYQAALAALETS
ncbi:redoxin domain-containing protein [Psychromicrobium sp. YIM B11713]|uniref:redoxin domain-containing protein n=1 Tax=Psychromicrobium sp. YIM B11713 TaxID=3145233 RepID=UPI00374EAC7E